MKDLRDTLPDDEYDLHTIKEYFHHEVEVEQDGETFIEDRWECPQCEELHDTEREALECCQSWADRDLEGWKEYLRGNE